MSKGLPKGFTNKRKRARSRAIQALYQLQLTGYEPADIEQEFLDGQDMAKTDLDYFHELITQVTLKADELDDVIVPLCDRKLDQLDPIELAILRLAMYELKHHIEIPFRVVVNEAIELAKKFGSEDGHKFVNAVVDKAVKQLRVIEAQQSK